MEYILFTSYGFKDAYITNDIQDIINSLNDNMMDIYQGEVQHIVMRHEIQQPDENGDVWADDTNVLLDKRFNNTTHKLVAKWNTAHSVYHYIEAEIVELNEEEKKKIWPPEAYPPKICEET